MLIRWLTAVVSCLQCASAARSSSWLRSPPSTARPGTILCACPPRWPPWSACGRGVRVSDRVSELTAIVAGPERSVRGEGDAAHGDDRNGQGRALTRGVHEDLRAQGGGHGPAPLLGRAAHR